MRYSNTEVNLSRSVRTATTALFSAVFAVAFCVSGIAQAVTKPLTIIEEWKATAPPPGNYSRHILHILSPDGSLQAHLGPRAFADGLFVKNVATEDDRLILKTVGGFDVFSDLSFSPDGQRVMFLAGGGTSYYPHDVFTVRIDGSHLTQLTNATPMKWLSDDDKYYDVESAIYSPDGRHILVKVIHGESHEWSVGLLSPDKPKQDPIRLVEGNPLFWSTDGASIYYAGEDGIYRINVANKQSDLAADGKGFDILGRVPGTNGAFVLKRQSNVIPTNVLTVLSLDGTEVSQELADEAARIPFRDSEGRYLQSIDGAGPHQLLLTYVGITTKPNSHQQLVSFQ